MSTCQRIRLFPAFPLLIALTGATLLVGCEAIKPTPPEELGLWRNASGTTENQRLSDLCEDAWDAHLASHPVSATYLSDPRFHGDLPRIGPRGNRERTMELRDFMRRSDAIDANILSDDDRITYDTLRHTLRDELKMIALELGTFTVDPLRGPHVTFQDLVEVQPVATSRQRAQLVERWRSMDGYVRQVKANLRKGLSLGRVAGESATVKVLAQLNEFLDTPEMDSPLVTIATAGGEWVPLEPGGNVARLAFERLGDATRQRDLRLINLHLQEGDRIALGTRVLLPSSNDPLSPAERGRFLNAVLTSVEDEIYPAMADYRSFLRDHVLPVARSDQRPGISHVPGGNAAYLALVRHHTTLPAEECDPRVLHEFGLTEVARIRGRIQDLGRSVFGTGSLVEIQKRLRGNPEMHFADRSAVQATADAALTRARLAMPAFFGILPMAEVEVVPVPAHAERDTTAAYYRGPAPDGSRPGRYYVNTYKPGSRPRYQAEALAFHEAIPGHHLQIAVAQEREGLPLFRRHDGSTAFSEGWALYTERLADEMNLYSGDLDRLGAASQDAWRAARLVVDTGLHAFNWTRDQAVDYLFENTLLSKANVEVEVDRYIAWPAQALSYKVGEREILALREQAQRVLGESFQLAAFHDRLLENGALPLDVLRGVFDRWLSGAGI